MMNYDEIPARFDNASAFVRYNGIHSVSCSPDRAVMQAEVTPHALNAHSGAHGGFTFSLADSCAGLLSLADGRKHVTLDSSFHFLRAPQLGDMLTATAEPVRRGRSITVIHVSVTAQTGALVADGTFSMYCLGEQGAETTR